MADFQFDYEKELATLLERLEEMTADRDIQKVAREQWRETAQDYQRQLEEVTAQRDGLLADKERLDWLWDNWVRIIDNGGDMRTVPEDDGEGYFNIREAIDAARKATAPPAEKVGE